MITFDDIVVVADRQSKTYATNQAMCDALGVDVQSISDSPLRHYSGVEDLMSGICIGLELGKALYRENQDHAPTENHDEFLESLPEAYENLIDPHSYGGTDAS